MKKHAFIIGMLSLFVFSSVAIAMGEAPQKSEQARVIPAAADFTLKDLKGNDVALSSFRGKQVLITFGATWCHYCVAEVPELNTFFDKHKDKDVKVLSVDIGESLAKVSSFAQKNNIKYTILLDENNEVSRKYKVSGIPAIFLIDENGIIKYSGTGKPKDGFEALIK